MVESKSRVTTDVSPYHVTDVSSPERMWMESLRQGGVPVPVPTAAAAAEKASPATLRSAHSYQPMQRFGSGAAGGEELKFAFDMDLQRSRGQDEDEVRQIRIYFFAWTRYN
jgi:hypothetical protein